MANGKSQMRTSRWSGIAICSLLLAIYLPACEERVVYNRPLFSGLPGVQTSEVVTGPKIEGAAPVQAVPDAEIVVENPDGTKTLIARNGRQLMIHIHNTLRDDEGDLFVEQVLSERTREEYFSRGRQPIEAFKALKKRRADVKKLFDQMPMGEFTPGLYVRNMPGKITRLEANGSGARDLAWTSMDMVFENGNWKLVWFDGPGR